MNYSVLCSCIPKMRIPCVVCYSLIQIYRYIYIYTYKRTVGHWCIALYLYRKVYNTCYECHTYLVHNTY
ncbi:GSCOCG00000441001-RA-CDS [Cotesia congregata]|nr:GSCOCG00000441001-RA-CDS [Cotesia congregata]